MQHQTRVVAVVLVVGITLGGAGRARADEPPTAPTAAERAATLKSRGDAAMDARRFDEALAAYDEAIASSPDPAILYNRGRVYEARGQYAQALADCERFDREASPELRAKVPKLATLLAELRGKVSTLTVTSNVQGARVVVRDVVVATTPIPTALKLVAGPAVIEVIADGCAPFKRTIQLPGGGEALVDATLIAKNQSGVLLVKAPADATVSVDGAPIGNGSFELSVAAGNHSLVARRAGDEDARTATVVAVGERKEVTMGFQSGRPITSKWWFWTGIGAVVVAGTVVTVSLLVDKSPPTGDKFAPDTVRAPLMRW
jgi:hypothetical protein